MRLVLAVSAAFIFVSAMTTFDITAANALGGCGFNGHRGYYGRCVFGGQNQNFCLRTKGHPAVRMPNGTYRCI